MDQQSTVINSGASLLNLLRGEHVPAVLVQGQGSSAELDLPLAPQSPARSLLAMLKGPTTQSSPSDPPPATDPLATTPVLSMKDLEGHATFAPVAYKPPGAKQAYEKIDENLLIHRLVAIIRSAGDDGTTLERVGIEYRRQHPPLAPAWRLASMLPPLKFHPHVIGSKSSSGSGEVTLKFSSVAQTPPAPTPTPTPTAIKASASPPLRPAAAPTPKEPTGVPRCGNLALNEKPFEILMTGQHIRNAVPLSTLIQKSLRYVIDGASQRFGCKTPSPAMHLALINASLLLTPRESATMWLTLGRQAEVVDVAAHITGVWGGGSVTSVDTEPSFSAKNKAAWPTVLKQIYVLFSLPGRRLVTYRDGRLLLLGSAGTGKPCTLIGASAGAWHLSAGGAKEEEVCDAAVAVCKRAGILPAKLDNDCSALWIERETRKTSGSSDGALKSSAPTAAATAKSSNAFSAFGDDDSEDEDD